jgi:hypothetical protein
MVDPIQGITSQTQLGDGATQWTQPTDPESLRRFNQAANGPLPTFEPGHEVTPDDLWRTVYSLITRRILDDAKQQEERLKDALR